MITFNLLFNSCLLFTGFAVAVVVVAIFIRRRHFATAPDPDDLAVGDVWTFDDDDTERMDPLQS